MLRQLLKGDNYSRGETNRGNTVPTFFVGPLSYAWSIQRYTYIVLQTIQMKLILLNVWAEPAALGSTKTALKFKHAI